ncbi:hypothetical protein [Bacteroides sp.]|uniref:hypothetical protein n=1 Tax=Bacteroides sp. TaxID=29523 RepID=UPI002609A200|nr:hypothetical protein [Bacteroides sp.]
MRHFYSIVATLLFVLVTSTGCEEDYRDMILFEGAEPIFGQDGNNNLISSVTLYLTNPEGLVLGIDGGDGNYSLDEVSTVAAVTLSESQNGYSRIKVTPKDEGVVTVRINDGSGASAILKIIVRDRYKFYYFVEYTTFFHTGEIEENHWNQIMVDLTSVLTVKDQGAYTLIPDNTNDSQDRGELLVHPSAFNHEVIMGTYEVIEGENGENTLCFKYNDEVHKFTRKSPENIVTKNSSIPPLVGYEDVTSLSPAAVPQGCKVYRAEHWMYLTDDLLTDE